MPRTPEELECQLAATIELVANQLSLQDLQLIDELMGQMGDVWAAVMRSRHTLDQIQTSKSNQNTLDTTPYAWLRGVDPAIGNSPYYE